MSNLFALNLPLIYALFGVLGLIALNVALGIILALVQKTFSLQLLPQYLTTEIPYFLALLALVAIAQINFSLFTANLGVAGGWLVGLAVASLSAYSLKMVQEIGQKVLALFGVTVDIEHTKNEKGFIRLSALLVMLALVIVVLLVLLL